MLFIKNNLRYFNAVCNLKNHFSKIFLNLASSFVILNKSF